MFIEHTMPAKHGLVSLMAFHWTNAPAARSIVIRVDPKQKGLLFIGTETTVYVSFDDGDHWQTLRQTIVWVDTDGKVEWVAPNEATATFVGEQLTGIRLVALQEALRTRRPVFSPDFRGSDQRRTHDLILPVQRGSSDIGAFIAQQTLETLLRATLPASFTARYSLSVVDADNREVLSNSSIKPTDRRISGTISLNLPNNRLGLNIVAYRGSGSWLSFVPAALIVNLTLIATATLFQLRRHAQRRAETEEQLAPAFSLRRRPSPHQQARHPTP